TNLLSCSLAQPSPLRVLPENSIRRGFASSGRIIASLRTMLAILHLLGMLVADLFKSRSRLDADNLFLRHQLNLALRQKPPRIRLRGSDRALLVWMVRLWPSLLDTVHVVQPETILRWHRAGFGGLSPPRNGVRRDHYPARGSISGDSDLWPPTITAL